ncbi:EPSP synthase-domain-containing protein [Piptocephalis cylindrospora]|uniref:3-phosphoshikimate 1-carboxyvinyltransferase n=1 Tax=Piptocephalis cylindrospora TaxID=1907219 RepID=A0A4P9Y3F8_9FUNG|nr:EPSP synthase-domain-containing protein [Piptocephalis cylindrospora]|eukprot:RKP13395.1 EPSP synthase-domain-containing protein [Piptocephalis cylindrospora]
MSTATTPSSVTRVSILGEDSLVVGFGLTHQLAQEVISTVKASSYVVITDAHVGPLHAQALEDALSSALSASSSSARVLRLTVSPGEVSKSREEKARLEDQLFSAGCTRDTCILALGGGVVGDLAGYVAATFMRGVPFVQIPTSLLAMVDSSIGGKTGIDTPHGKNLIGAFWQPRRVFMDITYLRSLPTREFHNGMAEIIKTAAIWNEDDFSILESHSEEIRQAVLSGDDHVQGQDLTKGQALLQRVILGSIRVKAHVVTEDERESGLRGLLNFGHTIGHAYEAECSPHLLHGECVALGMVREAEVARALGHLSGGAVGRLVRCLRAYKLPTAWVNDPIIRERMANAPTGTEAPSLDALMGRMKLDKKTVDGGKSLRLVLLSRIGHTLEERASPVEASLVRAILSDAVKVYPAPLSLPKDPVVPTIIAVPGSKSISNRALLLAALSRPSQGSSSSGECRLKGLLVSDDTQVMLGALESLGACTFRWEDHGETLVVCGASIGPGLQLHAPANDQAIYLGNAGTAARFLTTVAVLVGAPLTLTGNPRMQERPIAPLVTALRSMGADITYENREGCLPLRYGNTNLRATSQGSAPGGVRRVELAATVSSQYVSSLLLSAPFLAGDAGMEITLVGGKVISQPYIDMTLAMMRDFGATITRNPGTDIYHVSPLPNGYQAPPEYIVEGDASSATYPLAFAAVTGRTVRVSNVGATSLQGDAQFGPDVLGPMGCHVEQGPNWTQVQGPIPRTLGGPGLHPHTAQPALDMEPMTDAFLTASVVAALAGSPNSPRAITRIRGIANQRVKECDRIGAMNQELGKFGIRVEEDADGLDIWGVGGTQAQAHRKTPDSGYVHCYDDHRVAMSFSILAAGLNSSGVVLAERRCVEKTWPAWWDTLSRELGLDLEGVKELDLSSHQAQGQTRGYVRPRKDQKMQSIVLIGMRGAGKSTLGRRMHTLLSASGWRHVDLDEELERKTGRIIREWVQQEGWKAFREAEALLLQEMLRDRPHGWVLVCGGGVVETPEARNTLKTYTGPVVHVCRPIQGIIQYLEGDGTRPQYGERVADVWARRRDWYESLATHAWWTVGKGEEEIVALRRFLSFLGAEQGSSEASEVSGMSEYDEEEGSLTASRILRESRNSTDRGTFFTSLTWGSFQPSEGEAPYREVRKVAEGVDALEFRADLLDVTKTLVQNLRSVIPSKNPQEIERVLQGGLDAMAEELALYRASGGGRLPTIFTLRTSPHGGVWPGPSENDDPLANSTVWEEGWSRILTMAFQWGVELVDVEVGHSPVWEAHVLAMARSHPSTHIIGSWHDAPGISGWNEPRVKAKMQDVMTLLSACNRSINGDGPNGMGFVKLIPRANKVEDCLALRSFLEAHAPPLTIAMAMGEEGKLSRVLGQVLVPVTHSALPSAAAPGQLTVRDIGEMRSRLGMGSSGSPKSYYILGSPIAQSLSPTLHGATFQALGLPHTYGRYEASEVTQGLRDLLVQRNFGGASVTIPLKELVIPLMTGGLTPAAQIIGAVNTIMTREGQGPDAPREFVGDNTDWLGMVRAYHRVQASSILSGKQGSRGHKALIVGAGGTARAAVYAAHQLGYRVIHLWNRTASKAYALTQSFPFFIEVLENLPEAAKDGYSLVIGTVPAGSDVPWCAPGHEDHLFVSSGTGVAIEMAYVGEAKANGKANLVSLARGAGWSIVTGKEVLVEQAAEQARRWTGRSGMDLVMWESIGL